MTREQSAHRKRGSAPKKRGACAPKCSAARPCARPPQIPRWLGGAVGAPGGRRAEGHLERDPVSFDVVMTWHLLLCCSHSLKAVTAAPGSGALGLQGRTDSDRRNTRVTAYRRNSGSFLPVILYCSLGPSPLPAGP